MEAELRNELSGRLPRCFLRLAKPLRKPSDDDCMTWDCDHSCCQGGSAIRTMKDSS